MSRDNLNSRNHTSSSKPSPSKSSENLQMNKMHAILPGSVSADGAACCQILPRQFTKAGTQKRQACYPDSREPAPAPSPGKTGKESPPSCPGPLLLSDAGGRTLSSNNLPLLNIKVEWLTKQLGRREEVYCVEQTLFSLQYQEIHSIQSGCRRLWRHLEPFFPSTWTSVAFNGTELQ